MRRTSIWWVITVAALVATSAGACGGGGGTGGGAGGGTGGGAGPDGGSDGGIECSGCHVDATCVDDGTGVGICQCNDGFDGDGMTCAPATCAPVCGTNAFCNESIECECEDGFEGNPVAGCTGADECTPNPCQNDGACTDGDGEFTCACTDGWEGATCDTEVDCGALSPAAPLEAAAATTTYLSAATYTCAAGYTLNTSSGDATRTCTAEGTWSGAEPSCDIVSCGAPSAPASNGSVATPDGTDYSDVADYSCEDGYSLGGNATRTCQADGTWSGTVPTCSAVDCGALSAPTDGSVDTAGGTAFGDTATYACTTGYVMTGSATRTCQATGDWDGSEPTCAIANCGAPPAPTDGSVATPNGTEYNDAALYACDTGHTTDDTLTRICQGNESWSGSVPTCSPFDCGSDPAPINGSVSFPTGTTYGNSAEYACDLGYSLVGSASRACGAAGTWEGTRPTCAIVSCGAPVTPANGSVSTPSGTEYQDVATFSCGTGYDLVGDTTSTCTAAGTWSNSEPSCVIRDCGVLTAPANGSVDAPSTTYDATATYSCEPGFELVGASSRQCGADGNWIGTAPTCEMINGCDPDPCQNGGTCTQDGLGNFVECTGCDAGWTGSTCSTPVDCGSLTLANGSVSAPAGTGYGATAIYSCNAGYEPSGGDLSRTCDATGSWTGIAPTCVLVDCGPPAAPGNGSVSTPDGTSYDDTASYACDTGYAIASGDATRTCGATGDWSGTEPTCQIVSCTALSNPSNGAVSTPSGIDYGDTATYSCNTGYALVGNSTRDCDATGTWTGSAPTCTLIDCQALPNPENGSVSTPDGTAYGDTATYSCTTGYVLNGASSRTCESSGLWDGAAPTCDIAQCGGLDAPLDGAVSTPNGTEYLDQATYSCDPGFDVTGTNPRTCQANQTWSGTAPTCELKDCGALGNPVNGSVDTTGGTLVGATATYSCTTGYDLSGESMRTCGTDGAWSGAAPTCAIVDCGALAAVAPLQVSAPVTTYGAGATYTCAAGYELSPDEPAPQRTCGAGGAWSGAAPSCVASCGDGGIDGGEQCDDGNATRWDGCYQCQTEQVFRVTSLNMLATTPAACTDLPHTGTYFNVLGRALDNFTLAGRPINLLNEDVNDRISAGTYILLSHPLDLDNTTAARLGQTDASVRLAMLEGAASGTFSGAANAPFLIADSGTQLTGVNLDPNPDQILAPGSIASSVISAGAGTGAVTIPVNLGADEAIPLRLYDTLIEGTITNDGTRATGITSGILCGTVRAADLDALALEGSGSLMDSYCSNPSILDAFVRGCSLIGNTVVAATQPNIDLEGDGIATTSLTASSGNQVNVCYDGSAGTRIPAAGTDQLCPQNAAFDDGYGVAYSFTATYVRFDGTSP